MPPPIDPKALPTTQRPIRFDSAHEATAPTPSRPSTPGQERDVQFDPALEATTQSLPRSPASRPPSVHSGVDERLPKVRPPSAYDPPTLALLSLFAILGTLARLGLNALNTYDGQSVFPLLWSQAIGCALMGFFTFRKAELEVFGAHVYVGLATGLCGSITTFSSWMLQVFQAYSNEPGYNRHGLHNVMDAFSQTFTTLGMSLAALAGGRALHRMLPPLRLPSSRSPSLSASEKPTPRRQRRRSLYVSPVLSTALGFAAYLAAILVLALAPHSWRPKATFALILSPPGAILRWWLARLNTKPHLQPYGIPTAGTFAANTLATALLAACYLLQRVRPVHPSAVGCDALQAVEDGFCGTLSTVSTFALELYALAMEDKDEGNDKGRFRAWAYAVGSYAAGQALMVLILGSGMWTLRDRGEWGPRCSAEM